MWCGCGKGKESFFVQEIGGILERGILASLEIPGSSVVSTKEKELRDRYIKIGRLFLSFFCYLQRANEAVQVEYSRCGPEQGEHVAERGDGIRADPTGLTRDQTRMETVAQGNVKT